ncbi:LCP family protein [Lactococcus allomyrinae]|uniref:Regulatory protein MsrR n=1 Tax=Lactococcus allomyrinae TaxID=2419773 RepID=A0A387BF58_9LACT|nr:LCP family protein [Lactococcus allomyrinae]AYG00732.1 LytR family transcriptional regulator [Lactococcus allomyrinae]
MNDKKYKRLEYLRHNIDYLTIRERQEYYELLNEFTAHESYYNPEEAEEYSGYEAQTNDYDSGYSDEGVQHSSASNRRSGRNSSISPTLSERRKNVKKDKDSKKSPKLGKNGKKKKHWLRRILSVIILIIVVMAGFFVYGYSRGVKHEGGVAKPETFTSLKNSDGSVNILLLGADKRPGQSSDVAHTDTIMVLHMNAKDHQMRLVSFMRDTLVNVPGVSGSSKINSAFTVGEQENRQGVNLMSETLKENFGVNCQYYAVVDFSSFATIIDSLFPTGLKIDAKFSTVNGQKLSAVPVPDDLSETEGKTSTDKVLTADEAAALGYPDGGGTFMMIKPGVQKMDGRTLLNYARFRHDDEGDFGRVKRQQQVLETVMSKMKNPLTLFTGSSALGTTRAVTMTNIPNSFLLTSGIKSLFDMKNGIKSTTIPNNNDWQNAYDRYGGLGLSIDMVKYKAEAEKLLGQ